MSCIVHQLVQLLRLHAIINRLLQISPACLMITLILNTLLILAHLSSSASALSPPGFVSIDCGSSRTSNYTDALGIEWTPDTVLWPDIGGWSSAVAVGPPANGTTGDEQDEKYKTLRYFPATTTTSANATSTSATSSSTTFPTKFCYVLPAIGEQFYLVRATFWYGSTSTTTTLYGTREPDTVSFRMIVDTYAGAQINVRLPQGAPLTEEMYVRAQRGSTSISVCFSAAGSDGGASDPPFVSALELRPLPATVGSVMMVNATNTALRRADQVDFGAAPDAPPIIRYPDDTLDRLWATHKEGNANRTSAAVATSRDTDYVPVSVAQTSLVGSIAHGWSYNATVDGYSHTYYVALFFAEVDPSVNASGLRVFDVTINGESFSQGIDVYYQVGLDKPYEIYTYPGALIGPYSSIVINGTANSTSVFPPFIAGAEILQLLDDPMAPPTHPVDVVGIRGIASAFPNQLGGRFTGDPCLPVGYPYPWVNCTGQGILPTRVISISLSNSNLAGMFPSSIINLDQLVQISFDGNALEGTLPPDLGNLANLQFLNLSNNKLTGFIPDSLGKLQRLTHLDLRNNNLSGEIPQSLQQKASIGLLDFRYDGNPFLCLSSNATCASSSKTPSKLPLIGGLAGGAAAACVVITILMTCIIIRKRRMMQNTSLINSSNENEAGPPAKLKQNYELVKYPVPEHHANIQPYHTPAVLSQTKLVKAANVSQTFTYQEIIVATHNFSTVLGRGGFGIVYKGTLKSGTTVAIKVLSDASQQSERQFLTEVTILSRVHHKNLVRLLGYCNEEKLILVYEYMPNGSLYDCLLRNNLTWIQRLRIMLDAAQGLAYLHGNCEPRIIHMDVKSSNILLNRAMEGKMSDFGISRQHSSDGNQLTMTLVASQGYMDPEFAITLEWSERVDVYSFGVVLLEAMSGRQPFIRDQLEDPEKSIHIVEWARDHYERGNIERILFNGIGDYNDSAVWKVAETAMACAQIEGWKRPSMDEVCRELGEALRLEMRYIDATLDASSLDTDAFPTVYTR